MTITDSQKGNLRADRLSDPTDGLLTPRPPVRHHVVGAGNYNSAKAGGSRQNISGKRADSLDWPSRPVQARHNPVVKVTEPSSHICMGRSGFDYQKGAHIPVIGFGFGEWISRPAGTAPRASFTWSSWYQARSRVVNGQNRPSDPAVGVI
jgi:hypothetical protein